MSKRAIIQATQIMIAFHIEGEGEQDIKDLLKMLIQIGAFLWGFWRWANRKKRQIKGFFQDCQEAISFTVKVMTIGFNTWAYGMGVKV